MIHQQVFNLDLVRPKFNLIDNGRVDEVDMIIMYPLNSQANVYRPAGISYVQGGNLFGLIENSHSTVKMVPLYDNIRVHGTWDSLRSFSNELVHCSGIRFHCCIDHENVLSRPLRTHGIYR
jgi:hypothetical protein